MKKNKENLFYVSIAVFMIALIGGFIVINKWEAEEPKDSNVIEELSSEDIKSIRAVGNSFIIDASNFGFIEESVDKNPNSLKEPPSRKNFLSRKDSYEILKSRIFEESPINYDERITSKWGNDTETKNGLISIKNESVRISDITQGADRKSGDKRLKVAVAKATVKNKILVYRAVDGAKWDGTLKKMETFADFTVRITFVKNLEGNWKVFNLEGLEAPVMSTVKDVKPYDVFSLISEEPKEVGEIKVEGVQK